MGDIKLEAISEEVKEKLYSNLGMTPASIRRDVAYLKEWMEKQPHLPHTDDKRLESFLFNCKNSLEAAKIKLENYFTVRVTMPDFFTGRDPELDNFLEYIVYTVLPRLTKNNERVVLFHMFDMPPSQYKPIETGRAGLMMSDILVKDDTNAGLHIVYDSKGVFMEHTASIPLQALKNFIYCFNQAYPLRINGIHILNATPITIATLNLARLFLKEKLRDRIHVHSTCDTLVEKLGKDTLPEQYGGTYPHTMGEIREFCHKTLLEHRDWFMEENALVSNLSKKPGAMADQVPQGQMFGLEGSFRKIEID